MEKKTMVEMIFLSAETKVSLEKIMNHQITEEDLSIFNTNRRIVKFQKSELAQIFNWKKTLISSRKRIFLLWTCDGSTFYWRQRKEWWLCIYVEGLPIKVIQNLCPLFFIKFLFFPQMIALQKLWKMFFISSKNLFSLSRYSSFCNFSSSFPKFPEAKDWMEVE